MKLDNLNANELLVLQEVANAAMNNGGDFACSDEVHVDGMNRKQVGAYLASLANKGLIDVHEPHKVNGEYWVTQITFVDADVDAIEALANGGTPEATPAPETTTPAPEPTEDPEALAYATRKLERMVEARDAAAAALAEKLATDPGHALRWSQDAFDKVALGNVAEHALVLLAKHGLKATAERLAKAAVSKGRYPERSTSTTGRLLDEAERAAWCELADALAE